MFTSWSEVSTPAELSMASVSMRPPARAYSMRPGLGDAEVGALAHHLGAAARAPLMRTASLARSPTSTLALGRRLHIGADAAEPEQVDRRLAGSP